MYFVDGGSGEATAVHLVALTIPNFYYFLEKIYKNSFILNYLNNIYLVIPNKFKRNKVKRKNIQQNITSFIYLSILFGTFNLNVTPQIL